MNWWVTPNPRQFQPCIWCRHPWGRDGLGVATSVGQLTITITKIISITNSNHIFKSTENQPRDAPTSTTAMIGIINKYFADIQTSLMMGYKPLKFWYNICPKAYSQLSVLALTGCCWQHLPHRPLQRGFFLFVECSVQRDETEWGNLEMRVWLKVNFSVLRELECKMTLCDRNVLE